MTCCAPERTATIDRTMLEYQQAGPDQCRELRSQNDMLLMADAKVTAPYVFVRYGNTGMF